MICIECLSHLIQATVDNGFWKPISLSHDDPPLTHLCFADDLFIFTAASMGQIEVIKKCLELLVLFQVKRLARRKHDFFSLEECSSFWSYANFK